MPAGRPRKYNKKQVDKLLQKFEIYIETTDIPILSEFAYLNDIARTELYDYKEFSTLKERCLQKKEAQLEKLGLTNAVNPTMAIFSLKQLGWKDKHDIAHEVTGKVDVNYIEKYLKGD